MLNVADLKISFGSGCDDVPAHGVVKVPDDAPLDILGPFGCGIMTGSGAVFNVLKPKSGSAVAVFGTGALGMSGMLAAKARDGMTLGAMLRGLVALPRHRSMRKIDQQQSRLRRVGGLRLAVRLLGPTGVVPRREITKWRVLDR